MTCYSGLTGTFRGPWSRRCRKLELAISEIDRQQEDARLAALSFDGNSRHSAGAELRCHYPAGAEYFKADTVLLGFADESRVWIKSYWGEPVRELPRKQSIFELVLAEDGPVVVPDISKHPAFRSGACLRAGSR